MKSIVSTIVPLLIGTGALAQSNEEAETEFLYTICSSQAFIGQKMLEQSRDQRVSLAATDAFSDLGKFNMAVADTAVSDQGIEQVVNVANDLSMQVTNVFQTVQPHMSIDLAGMYYFLMCYDGKDHETIMTIAKYLGPAYGKTCEGKNQQETWSCFERVSSSALEDLEKITTEYGIRDEVMEGARKNLCEKFPDSEDC